MYVNNMLTIFPLSGVTSFIEKDLLPDSVNFLFRIKHLIYREKLSSEFDLLY